MELGHEADLVAVPFLTQRGAMHARNRGSVDETNRALFYLYQNPWFMRVWVVQEVLLAPKSQCYLGKSTRTLYRLLCGANWLSHKCSIPRDMLGVLKWSRLEAAITLLPYVGDEGDSHKLLRKSTAFWGQLVQRLGRGASDQRDNIFGFLGLGAHLWKEGGVPELLRPDYTKSVKDVYRDAMTFAIQEHGVFYPLQFLQPEDRSLAAKRGLPSWVIAWDHSPGDDEPWTVPIFVFDAARSLLPKMSDVLSAVKGDILEVPAVIIESVEAITHAGKRCGDLRTWVQACHYLVKHSSAYGDESRKRAMLTRTLCAIEQPRWQEQSKMLESLMRAVDHCLDTRFSPSESLRFSFDKVCHGRRFFATSHYMGIGPAATKPGDMICIILGTSAPFVVRQCRSEYRMIGTAYLDGLMFGEAMDGVDINSPSLQTLRIC